MWYGSELERDIKRFHLTDRMCEDIGFDPATGLLRLRVDRLTRLTYPGAAWILDDRATLPHATLVFHGVRWRTPVHALATCRGCPIRRVGAVTVHYNGRQECLCHIDLEKTAHDHPALTYRDPLVFSTDRVTVEEAPPAPWPIPATAHSRFRPERFRPAVRR